MLDVAVYVGNKDPLSAIWTAESEGFAGHNLASHATSETSDYGWDLFKLLQVPSPRRLFVMRTVERYNEDAWEPIEKLVNAYSRNYATRYRIYAIVFQRVNTIARWCVVVGGEKSKRDLRELKPDAG